MPNSVDDTTEPIDLLNSLDKGQVVQDLAVSMVLVAEEVVRVRKAGTVTLTLTIKPAAGSDTAVVITDDLKRKPPASGSSGSMYFALGDGVLRKHDARQTQFTVEEVEPGKTRLEVVENEPRVREAQ